ncbi:hypothetical protein ACFSTA_17420 [Ornithinibacillus salinisoli]|uniref:Uncharacterized protein n=1 Tax=Ornithinibacillus salinisoli TaxID=1848459 RepID=A0ABW4W2Z2_9BACI
MKVIYEESFDLNEWFVIIIFVVTAALIWITPKIFSVIESIAYFVFGFFWGMFFDHTLSTKPWDFYDVNDNSSYQIIDVLSYAMYGPFSYFFIYLYVRLNIHGFYNLLYIFIWCCLSLVMEWVGVKIGVFHYDKGYNMFWSFPIYAFVQSTQIMFYHLILKKNASES